MIKFIGLDCKYDENNEPIVQQHGLMPGSVLAVYTFNATIPKGIPVVDGKKIKTVYEDRKVKVRMQTMVDPLTPSRDWKISAQSFADLWVNASKRHERLVFEGAMMNVGVTFDSDGDKWKPQPTTLLDMYKPKEW